MKRKRDYRTVRSSKVKEPLRLAVVADLHDKPFEDVMEDLSSCDAILVPGDLVSRHRKTFVFSERFLKEAPEAAPVFYSFGNHERKCAFAEEWRRKVKQSRVTFLDNESVGFRGIWLGGLTSHGAWLKATVTHHRPPGAPACPPLLSLPVALSSRSLPTHSADEETDAQRIKDQVRPSSHPLHGSPAAGWLPSSSAKLKVRFTSQGQPTCSENLKSRQGIRGATPAPSPPAWEAGG